MVGKNGKIRKDRKKEKKMREQITNKRHNLLRKKHVSVNF